MDKNHQKKELEKFYSLVTFLFNAIVLCFSLLKSKPNPTPYRISMKQQKSIFKVFEFVIDSMFSIKIYDQRWLSHNIIEIDGNLSFSRYFKYLLWPIDLGDLWMSIIIVNPYYPVRLSMFEQVMWQLNN